MTPLPTLPLQALDSEVLAKTYAFQIAKHEVRLEKGLRLMEGWWRTYGGRWASAHHCGLFAHWQGRVIAVADWLDEARRQQSSLRPGGTGVVCRTAQ